MAESITGSVVGKIKFTIDKPSWDNLDKFQKKLTSVKKQMSNMHKTINVNAVVRATTAVANAQVKAVEKVAKAKKKVEGYGLEFGRASGNNREYAEWWKDALTIQDRGIKESIRQQKNYIKQQQQMVKQANARAGMGGRLSWMFPSGGVSNKASGTLFAQMLRDEEKAGKAVKHTGVASTPSGVGLEFGKATGADRTYAAWWHDALKAEEKALKDYAKRRDRVVSARDKANAARRKRKAGEVSAQSAYMDSVNAFMTVKEYQVRNEAIRKGFYGTDKYAENMKVLQKAYADNVGLGNIKQFRSNVNGVVTGMHTMQRAAEANRITFASIRSELVQLTAAYSAFTVVQNIAQTGMEMEGLRASAKVFAKDEAGVADHMKFIADEANRLGVNFQEAARSFTKFSLSTKGKLDKNTQRQLFSGVSEYAAVLQLDTPSYQRFFRAIQQMTDKGLYA